MGPEGKEVLPTGSDVSKKENAMAKVATQSFDWATRLEQHPEEEHSPEAAFLHVEESLDNGVRKNMIVEMPLNENHDQFWLAKVDGVFGPLLSLTMIPESKKIIYDVSKRRLFPLGYCQMNRKDLIPPVDIKTKFQDWEQIAIRYLEDVSFDTVSMHCIDGDGVTPADRIKIGSVLQVKDKQNPQYCWPAKIASNYGGLLHLSYLFLDRPEDEVDLTLFYKSDRLVVKASGFSPPKGLKAVYNLNIEYELRNFKTPPSELFKVQAPPPHKFVDGELFEIIHPENGSSMEKAVLETISNSSYFRLKLENNPEVAIVRNLNNCHDVLPLGWSSELNIPGPKLEKDPKNEKLPVFEAASEVGFEVDQRLELLVTKNGKAEMHTARIGQIKDHVLVLKIESDASEKELFVVPSGSSRIFPIGWAQSNNLELYLPKSFLPEEKLEESIVEEAKDDSESSWCPPIYFNYKCYSSSFLSRPRLSRLPKSIGPGPVKLVMREVLNLIIGSSFKSGSVLKRLEAKKSVPPKDFVTEEFKGKSRVLILKADINIPTKENQIRNFCHDICAKVGACPYLISTEKYEDVCPKNCLNHKSKAEFKDEEQMQTVVSKKIGVTKRRKRRNPDALLLDEQRLQRQMSVDRGSTSSEETYSGDTNTAASSRTQSRSNSPDNSVKDDNCKKKKKEWSSLLPRSEMRTRGAKMPDWKLHMKIRPSVKDRKAMEMQEKNKVGIGLKGQKKSNTPLEFSCYDRRGMRPVEVKLGSGSAKRSTKRMELPAAFSMNDFPDSHSSPPSSPPMQTAPKRSALSTRQNVQRPQPPPPIRQIKLQKNPEFWTVNDTAMFIAQTSDCAHLAGFMKEDEVDGKAFMLLNFPTVKDYWKLKPSTAIRLCQHIESVRMAHIYQFS